MDLWLSYIKKHFRLYFFNDCLIEGIVQRRFEDCKELDQ